MHNRDDDHGSYRGGHAPYRGGRWDQQQRNQGSWNSQPQEGRGNADARRPGDILISPKKTFFRHPEEYRQAVSLLTVLLGGNQVLGKDPDDDGLYSVGDVLASMKQEDPSLYYMTRDHILEIYLKDSSRMIVLNNEKNLIGHTGGGMAIPPDFLYYGTTASVADKIRQRGLQSVNKPMLPISSSEEEALRKSAWYVNNLGEEQVVVTVDAKAAYESGVKFSYSGKPGEYLVERISPRFIKAIDNHGKPADNADPDPEGN